MKTIREIVKAYMGCEDDTNNLTEEIENHVKKLIDELDFDPSQKNNFAYQYRQSTSNTKALLKDFLNRVIKTELKSKIQGK